MIFVTVGTHEQPFNRLMEAIDSLIQNGTINEEVVIQSGYSTHEFVSSVKVQDFVPYEEMVANTARADVIICHGGPASFLMPIQMSKRPIVVPRSKAFDEHVNDHQAVFAKELVARGFPIEAVFDIKDLGAAIDRVKHSGGVDASSSHNQAFCDSLEQEIRGMFNI